MPKSGDSCENGAFLGSAKIGHNHDGPDIGWNVGDNAGKGESETALHAVLFPGMQRGVTTEARRFLERVDPAAGVAANFIFVGVR